MSNQDANMPGPRPGRRPFRAILQELKLRLPLYLDDWECGLRHPLKALASGLFMFFVSVFPALTFGNELAHRTHLEYGVMEVVLSTAACGVLFAIASGQPLVVVGVTGPITAFSAATYQMCKSFRYPFLPFMFWTCIWAAAMHWALAIWNCCDDLVKYVTRYSCEIFGVLIAIIYLFNGIDGVVRRYEGADPEQMSVFLLVTLNTLVVTVLSVSLGGAQSWWLFTPKIRFYIADWGVSLSVIFMWILVTCTPPWYYVRMRQLSVPPTFGPTRPRPWLVRPLDAPPAAIIFALLPAAILTLLIYFDHNVSSLLAQASHHALKKPPAYNFDFLVIGASLVLCGTLGLPPAHGLIPQAILHVESLVHENHAPRQGGVVADGGDKKCGDCTCTKNLWSEFWSTWLPVQREASPTAGGTRPPLPSLSLLAAGEVDAEQLHAVVAMQAEEPPPPVQKYVVETRLSGFLQSVFIGSILADPLMSHIKRMPPSLLYGTFLYMGIASFKGNQFFARFLAITVTEPCHRLKHYIGANLSPLVAHIPTRRVAHFTAVQFACLIVVAVITIAGGPASIAFPVLITLLIPLRHKLFPKLFTPQELVILDSWSAHKPSDLCVPAAPVGAAAGAGAPVGAAAGAAAAAGCSHASSSTGAAQQ